MNEITIDKYIFTAYQNLNEELKKQVLTERNKMSIRKWMNSHTPITLEEHINFIESLKTRNDAFYWLVLRNNKPIGAINIVDVDWKISKGIWGYFLFEEFHGTGWAVEVEFYALFIFFKVLKLNYIHGFVNKKNVNSLSIQPIFNFSKIGEDNNQIIFELTFKNYNKLPECIKEFKTKKLLNNGKS